MDYTNARAALEQIIEHLRRHRVAYVAHLAPLLDDYQRAEGKPSEYASLRRRTQELFGGMGTLNDVWIAKANGDDVTDEQEANRVLSLLNQRLWAAVET